MAAPSRSASPPARGLLPRPRLLRQLAGRWKLALVSAPAGFGKTTLAEQFAAAKPVLWCHVRAEDRDPAHLMGSLIAAGEHARPRLGGRTRRLFESRRDMERDSGLLLGSLLDELRAERAGWLVVLDDVHELAEARAAAQLLRRLVEDSDASLRFLVTCRGECPWPLARLEARGGVARVAATDLELTAREQHDLLRQVFGLRPSAEQESALRGFLGGWAAGWALAARHLERTGRAPSPPGAGPTDLQQRERLASYMAEESFAPLPAKLRRDLCSAAMLEELDPEALRVLLGPAAASTLLEEVKRRDLFVRPHAEGETPAFHPLFRDFLRRRAEQELPAADRRRAALRLARLELRRDRPGPAVRALVEGGAHAEAVRVYEHAAAPGRGRRSRGSLGTVALELSRRPGAETSSPWVLLHGAYQARDAGRLEECGRLAREAQWRLLAIGESAAAAGAFRLEAAAALMTGRMEPTLRHAPEIARRLPAAARGIVSMHAGELELYAGRPERARRRLAEAERLLRGSGNEVEQAEVAVRRATAEFTQGRWDVYLLLARRALPVLLRAGYAARAQTLLINMAEACTYRGEEDRALAHLDEARGLAARAAVPPNRSYEALGRARAHSERGEFAAAAPRFAEARRAVEEHGPPIAACQVDLWEGVMERRRGRLGHALERLERAAAGFERAESPAWLAVARMERALVVGLRGGATAALRDLAAAARVSGRHGDKKELARNALFEARIRQAAGKPCATPLRRALRALDREDYLVLLRKEADVARPLLAAGGVAPELLRRAQAAMGPGAARVPPGAAAGAGAGAARASRLREPLPVLEARLLGGFEVRADGGALRFPRNAAAALVACLALRRAPMRRESLMEALWPEADPDAVRNRFDVALNAARRALEPGAAARGPFHVLIAEGGVCRLACDRIRTDAERFERAARECEPALESLERAPWSSRVPPHAAQGWLDRLRAAERLYGGTLLPQWPDAPWAEAERERLRALWQRVLLGAGNCALALGRWAEAYDAARRALEDDPLSEEAVRIMLRAQGARGDRAAALHAYRAFTERLRRELDVAPSPQTVAVAEELGS